jgi:hypothetical protein
VFTRDRVSAFALLKADDNALTTMGTDMLFDDLLASESLHMTRTILAGTSEVDRDD